MDLVLTPSLPSSPAFPSQLSPASSTDDVGKLIGDVKQALDLWRDFTGDSKSRKSTGDTISTLDLGADKPIKEEDVAEGSGEKKMKDIVVTVDDLRALKKILAVVRAKEMDGASLSAQELGELLGVDKVCWSTRPAHVHQVLTFAQSNEDEPERAQAAPEDIEDDVDQIADDEVKPQVVAVPQAVAAPQAPEVVDVEELLALREPQINLLAASPMALEHEKIRQRTLGMSVGFAEQEEAYATYDIQVIEGLKLALRAKLEDEFKEGRRRGKLISRMQRVKASWKERRTQWYGQYHYRKAMTKQWMADTATTTWEVTKKYGKKYGPVILKALGILFIMALLKYLGFSTFERFAALVTGAWASASG
ncbi:hypothetical protein CALVIDRAFT_527348 [Calocera viscosa TUFC12733]|uniref:Uncharacterized protein n=1 Tax=Calocera viscosa (strain TUFC12733) TaxID=1330018 RepID=A0A167MFJ4_CALVF|nr:hypothetical protein CALVIDRAFT_527348 [Calocera viscosa TUFC12733]